jgi:hypothetical protein
MNEINTNPTPIHLVHFFEAIYIPNILNIKISADKNKIAYIGIEIESLSDE